MRNGKLIVLGLVCFSTGCALGPNYHRPEVDVPAQWSRASQPGTGLGAGRASVSWWTAFNDAELDALIAHAAQANYDLTLSAARVEEARAATGIATSSLYPQVDAGASAERVRQIGVGLLPPDHTGAQVHPVIFPYETNTYQGRFDASWEVDLFGRIRRQTEAARADVRRAEEDRRNVLVTVLGDVGRYYAGLRGWQLRLDIVNQNAAVAEDALNLTRALASAGQATERDVAQADAQLETVRAAIPQITAAIESSIHRLGVLTGHAPDALQAELASKAPLPVIPPEVPIGLPSDLLTRRPDIQSAEAQLAAATARVGEAKADYFPKFTLLGTAGRQAQQLHELTLGLGNFFAVGPSVSVPLFTGGRIRSNVAVQNARVDQALAAYHSTVLNSLEETENALVNYAHEQSRRDHLTAVVRSNRDALNLAETQYRAGLTDFLTVLDSERTLFTNQDALAQSQTAIVVDLIALYKALGGGWQ